jgi:hypothetical protein
MTSSEDARASDAVAATEVSKATEISKAGEVSGPAEEPQPSEPRKAAEVQNAADGPNAPVKSGGVAAWLRPESRARRLIFAVGIYVITTLVFAVFAGPQRLFEHTPFNHYALLADAWIHGRQDLPNGPPPYAMGNDFAQFHGRWYISFPPFPAVLMLPWVKLAGSPENFLDGQFAVELAGIAPAVLWLVLEKLRRTGRSVRSESENAVLALLFAFGTVYFFTSVEGTVWFIALVIGAALLALYTLFALDAERPALAGAMLGCAYLTRPFILVTAPLFALEALRVCCSGGLPTSGSGVERLRELGRRVRVGDLARRYALFSLPILGAFAFLAAINAARFGIASPFDFGHEYLTVGWHGRIMKWGLIGYHYLGKNLGIALTSLPWLPPGDAPPGVAPFQVNEHGLALWFTTPVYVWLLWPKGLDRNSDRRWLYAIVAISAAAPAAVDLLYQNSGWRQFGYRFSNDYSVLLFVLLALSNRPMRGLFAAAAAWSVAWNAFGAATFDKAVYSRFYFTDGSQTIVYQPD